MQTTTKQSDSKRKRRAPRGSQPRIRRDRPVADTVQCDLQPNGSSEEIQAGASVPASGVLELHPQGYGFLRKPAADYRPSPADVYVAQGLIEQLGLRPGSFVRGLARQQNSRASQLQEVHEIDGSPPESYGRLKNFASLTPINPHNWLQLETGRHPLTTRIIDLLAPLGMGQRALVVAPPRSGKTILLQQIGQAIGENYPEIKLFVLLIDERPEEVTDMRRCIPGEVLASSLDRTVENHVRLSRLVIERCKRLAESGHDVLLLVDSLTRMARAFNKWTCNSGRTMSGGLDIKALDIPKKLFASARAFEEGGSLTILATALIQTGSRMDDLIFEEFKGTGNSELVLDRQLADRRIWPAIDINRSGTRREELLLEADALQAATTLRRTLDRMSAVEGMQQLTTQLARYPSNRDFLRTIADRQARVA
jgi:transcription termination factor Rho